jgi:hypothetical protein
MQVLAGHLIRRQKKAMKPYLVLIIWGISVIFWINCCLILILKCLDLTHLLMNTLRENAPSRLVVVSSDLHAYTKVKIQKIGPYPIYDGRKLRVFRSTQIQPSKKNSKN